MKTNIYTFIITVLALTSCKNDILYLDNLEEAIILKQNDSIIQLEEKDFPKKTKKLRPVARSYEYIDVNTELRQLDGIDFFIQSSEFNYGNNTLETMGKGKELKVSSFSQTNDKQKFRLKFMPGI